LTDKANIIQRYFDMRKEINSNITNFY